MLYHLLYPLHSIYGGFRVFRYVSFRLLMAILTALAVSFLFGPPLIRLLKKYQIGQQIREEGPRSHLSKKGTPTMGGILIVFSFVLSFSLWARLNFAAVWILMLSTVGFAAIGFWDDFAKIRRKKNLGLTIFGKFKLQVFVSVLVAALLLVTGFSTELHFPFFKDAVVDLRWWGFIPFAVIVIVGTSNAVNLTDGLDGLAIGPVMVAALTYVIIAYAAGHRDIAEYLQIAHVKEAAETVVFFGAILGAGLGFLWFNTYPAQVFMGDVGSLALGAALGTAALVTKQELLLVVVGGVFVLETVSVIVQVLSFRTTGKRVFRMAPIHHHFELKGWAEPKVIVRFWIVSIILAILALSTLKLR